MQQQVLVDMDGVLADVYQQFINKEFELTGEYLDIKSMHGILESEAFPHFESIVRSEGFFRTVPQIPDSIEGLKYLNDKYKVLIVSSATEFPTSLKEKVDWLGEFYPFISWRQIILCGQKDSIKGDIMIDDHPKNLGFFDGQKIIFTQPHNIFHNEPEWQRIDGWSQIVDIL